MASTAVIESVKRARSRSVRDSLLREDISKLTFEPLRPGGSVNRTRSLDGMLDMYDGDDNGVSVVEIVDDAAFVVIL